MLAIAPRQQVAQPPARRNAVQAELIGPGGPERLRRSREELRFVVVDQIGAGHASGQKRHLVDRVPAGCHRHVSPMPRVEALEHRSAERPELLHDPPAQNRGLLVVFPARVVHPDRAGMAHLLERSDQRENRVVAAASPLKRRYQDRNVEQLAVRHAGDRAQQRCRALAAQAQDLLIWAGPRRGSHRPSGRRRPVSGLRLPSLE